MKTTILDVTKIEPRLKHPTIFQNFDDLKEGEAFVIHNDHDPKPLYYQLKATRGAIFDWEYLNEGPTWWEIKISKKIRSHEAEETIGEIAGKDLRNAEVFKEYGLEFCCDGNKPLSEACAEVGVDEEEVKKALDKVVKSGSEVGHDYNNWELDFLADYIVNVHHKYVRKSAQMFTDLSKKIATVHGDSHPELFKIKEHLDTLLADMLAHQKEEETVVFPFIRQIVQAEDQKEILADKDSIEEPIRLMKDEHKAVAKHVHAIEELSDSYKVPADGCESYRLYFNKLKELDDDLHLHIHLENNVLFPKALKKQAALN